MRITKKGDVGIQRIIKILPTKRDLFLAQFHCECLTGTKIVPMLFGTEKIQLKFWKDQEGTGTPTIISDLGLDWSTFDQDDNILVMIKQTDSHFMPVITILITKRYHQ